MSERANRPPRSARFSWVLPLLAAGYLVAPPAGAGTIYLLNGEEVQGEIVAVDATEVTLKYEFGTMRINLRSVRDIELRPGEFVWEEKIRRALEQSRLQALAEAERRRAEREGRQPAKPSEAGSAPQAPLPSPEVGVPAVRRFFGETYESSAWGFRLSYPSGWVAKEEAPGFFTFRDVRASSASIWSFNATVFDEYECDHATVVMRANGELERIAGYRVLRRRTVKLGRLDAERTVGCFEGGGRSIRHDQILVRLKRGTLVLHFFSPGAPLDEAGVPDVEVVLASFESR